MVYGVQVDIYSQVRRYDMTTQLDGARRLAANSGNGTVIPHCLLNKHRQVTEHVQVTAEIYTGKLLHLLELNLELKVKQWK